MWVVAAGACWVQPCPPGLWEQKVGAWAQGRSSGSWLHAAGLQTLCAHLTTPTFSHRLTPSLPSAEDYADGMAEEGVVRRSRPGCSSVLRARGEFSFPELGNTGRVRSAVRARARWASQSFSRVEEGACAYRSVVPLRQGLVLRSLHLSSPALPGPQAPCPGRAQADRCVGRHSIPAWGCLSCPPWITQ